MLSIMNPLLHVWLVYCLKFAFWLSDQVTDLLFGWTFTYGTRQERELARNSFEHSAHVVSVSQIATYHPEFPGSSITTAWLFKHVRYASPRIILENEKICLSHMTKESAVFGIPRPGEDIYDTKKYPFISIGIHYACDQYVILPLSSFHRIAEEVGRPKVPLGITAMTLRSGSTLISQIMSRVPNTRSMSEPFALDTIAILYHRKYIDLEDLRQRFRGAIRLFARTQTDSKVERVFIKLNGYSNTFLGLVREDFPNAKMIKSSRHPKPSLISYRKITAIFYISLHAKLGLAWNSHGVGGISLFLNQFNISKPKLYWFWKTISNDELCAAWYAGSLACFREFSNIFDMEILYEDLVAKPLEIVENMFELMEIDKKMVPLGMEALSRDSQNGIFNKKISTEITPQFKEDCDKWLKILKLPITVDCTMEEFRNLLHSKKLN